MAKELVSTEIIGLLYYLLPGLFAAWIFYGLTPHPRSTPFERLVQALIFTAIIQIPVVAAKWILLWIGGTGVFKEANLVGTWTADSAFILSMLFAAIGGTALAACTNTDFCHKRIRESTWFGFLTKRTSFPSEWFGALNQEKRWVTLHLHDGRRLYGWPYEWPDQSDVGHFVLMNAAWVMDDNECAHLYNVERMLVPASDIRFVDLLKIEDEVTATAEEREAVEETLRQHREAVLARETENRIIGDSEHGSESTTATAE